MFIFLLFVILSCLSFYFFRLAILRGKTPFIVGDVNLKKDPSLKKLIEADQTWWDNQPFSCWSLTSRDGLNLHAYYLPAKNQTNKTVVLAHGYACDAQIMKEFARLYHEEFNFNILVPDARGHGRSEGMFIGFGWKERIDYLDWLAMIIKNCGAGSDILLHGVSMGAATVMMVSGEQLPEQVIAIIADCGYTSVKEQLAYQLKRLYRLPAFPLIYTTSFVSKWLAGYSFNEASPLKQVKKATIPIMFIHGDQDAFVPTEMVHRLYQACSAEKRLVIIEGAGHGLANRVNPAKYKEELLGFLMRYGI